MEQTTTRLPSLINRAQTRRFILETARQTRAKKFTRVSKATLDDAEANHRAYCTSLVHRMPSVGQTL